MTQPMPRFLLVIPFGSAYPGAGSGQRSRLYFDALLGLGSVDVAYLTHEDTLPFVDAYREASAIHLLRTSRTRPRAASGLMRATQKALRLVAPDWTFRRDPAVQAQMAQLLDRQQYSAVVYRLSQPFTVGAPDTCGPPVLVDLDDREDMKYQTAVAAAAGQRFAESAPVRWLTGRFRRRLVRALGHADLVWYAKPADRLRLPGTAEEVIENAPAEAPDDDALTDAARGQGLFFIGNGAYGPNVAGIRWVLSEVWPLVLPKAPEARLRIAGLGDWSDCRRDFGHLSGVEFLGSIDDLHAAYGEARAAIAPIFAGAGSQIKVIEACAHARPVVATPLAASGFGEGLREHGAIAETPEAFAAACLHYISDAEAATRDGNALRDLQQRHFSWSAACERIREQVQTVIKSSDNQRQF